MSAYADQDPVSHSHRHPDASPRAYALRLVRATKYNSVWILFIVGFSLLSVERLVQLLLVSGCRALRSPLVVRLSGDRDLGLPVDRRDVRPQAVQIHRPSEPSAAAAQQAHPHGRAPHRGEGPVALLEGAARRTRAAALVGQDVAHGARARGARRRASARSSTIRPM